MLCKRAYSKDEFGRRATATPFGRADIGETPLGYDVWLRR